MCRLVFMNDLVHILIIQMSKGEICQLTVTPDLAYGEEGKPGLYPLLHIQFIYQHCCRCSKTWIKCFSEEVFRQVDGNLNIFWKSKEIIYAKPFPWLLIRFHQTRQLFLSCNWWTLGISLCTFLWRPQWLSKTKSLTRICWTSFQVVYTHTPTLCGKVDVLLSCSAFTEINK